MRKLLVPLIALLACGDLIAGAQLSNEAKANAVSAPRVEYPYEARANGLTGLGVYVMVLDARGNVSKVEIAQSSGHAILDHEAMSTFKRWRFKPAALKRVRVPVMWSLPRK